MTELGSVFNAFALLIHLGETMRECVCVFYLDRNAARTYCHVLSACNYRLYVLQRRFSTDGLTNANKKMYSELK